MVRGPSRRAGTAFRGRFFARRRRLVRAAAIAIVAASLAAVPAPRLAAQVVSEHEVKAAFLYNFAKFVEWPASADGRDTLVLCVLGEDHFGDLLESTVSDKTVRDRRLAVRRVARVDEARHCHVLFVGDPGPTRARTILDAVEGAPVLTVGDTEQFALRGGMIAFRMEGNKVRFVINAEAAARRGLNISSQLLKLAADVIDPPSTPR